MQWLGSEVASAVGLDSSKCLMEAAGVVDSEAWAPPSGPLTDPCGA